MHPLRPRLFLAVAVTAMVLASGCGDSPAGPGIQPEIVNTPNHFSYQISNIQRYSGAAAYTWQNSGVQATINQSCSVSGGSAILVVLDAGSTQVYSRSLSENGTFTTASGVAGTWTIRVIYEGTNATVNFRADMTT